MQLFAYIENDPGSRLDLDCTDDCFEMWLLLFETLKLGIICILLGVNAYYYDCTMAGFRSVSFFIGGLFKNTGVLSEEGG